MTQEARGIAAPDEDNVNSPAPQLPKHTAEPYIYTPPEFLQHQSADEIHRRMLDSLPDDIDKSELSIAWDFTRPAALVKSEFVQFALNESIKLIFPHWAYGAWLDLHADMVGLKRRTANKAFGYVHVTGKPGTTIEIGFIFATTSSWQIDASSAQQSRASSNPSSSLLFEACERVTLNDAVDERGLTQAIIPVQATDGGIVGNVAPDTIILMFKPDPRIAYVTNPKAITGGTESETDDSLRERILAVIRGGISYVGCDADYIRWAKEVPAVGDVVVDPEWDDPNMPEAFHFIGSDNLPHCAGAVRLFIVDTNGIPANDQILDAVYSHIVNPNNRLERLAPIGATVTVVAPNPIVINISARVMLEHNECIDSIKERFIASLSLYWLTASSESMIKYVYIGSALAETVGVSNYSHNTLTINDAVDDIPILLGEFPITGIVDIYV